MLGPARRVPELERRTQLETPHISTTVRGAIPERCLAAVSDLKGPSDTSPASQR